MEPYKFAYCGYDFSAPLLKHLCDSGHNMFGLYTWEVDGEYDTNHLVKQIASDSGASISTNPVSAHDFGVMNAAGVNLLICAGYSYKIPSEVNSLPLAFNLHPSDLPHGRGKWPMPFSILNGHSHLTVTAHKLTTRWDAGDILSKASMEIATTDTHETLCAKAALLQIEAAESVLRAPATSIANSSKQSRGSYLPMPTVKERTINWDMLLTDIVKIKNAFGRFCSYAKLRDKKVLIREGHPIYREHTHPTGSILSVNGGNIMVAVADGYFLLTDFDLLD